MSSHLIDWMMAPLERASRRLKGSANARTIARFKSETHAERCIFLARTMFPKADLLLGLGGTEWPFDVSIGYVAMDGSDRAAVAFVVGYAFALGAEGSVVS